MRCAAKTRAIQAFACTFVVIMLAACANDDDTPDRFALGEMVVFYEDRPEGDVIQVEFDRRNPSVGGELLSVWTDPPSGGTSELDAFLNGRQCSCEDPDDLDECVDWLPPDETLWAVFARFFQGQPSTEIELACNGWIYSFEFIPDDADDQSLKHGTIWDIETGVWDAAVWDPDGNPQPVRVELLSMEWFKTRFVRPPDDD